MRTLAPLLATLVLVASASAQDTARRPMTTDDGLDMVVVGGATIAPDGTWVLFSKSELDWKENKRKTTWWRADVGGGEPYRWIGEDGAGSPAFSPDGSRLAFTREVEGKAQVFVMRTTGGEAVKLTSHATSVGRFAWTDDASAIVFVADEPRPEAEEKAVKGGDDAIFVDEDANGQEADRWSNLWWVDAATGAEKRLTDGNRLVGAFDVTPDGSRVAFTARTENRRNQENLSELWLLDTAGGDVRRLTDNQSPESNPRWAPDGRSLAYEAAGDAGWDLRLQKLWVLDTSTGRHRLVSGAWEGNLGTWAWAPDGRAILFGGQKRTDTNLWRLDVASGSVTQVTHVVGTLAPSSFSRDRTRMAWERSDLATPTDVWAGPTDGSPGRRLTDANPWIARDIALARSEVVRWKSTDGTEIEGILLLPDSVPARTRLPLLLHIHGGPAGVFANRFSATYHVWAGLGYAQLLPNVRGSSGYTDALLRGNLHDIGGGDFQDLMTGVDMVVDRGIVSPDSLAVRGWSYGGILGGWTVTQTDRFKAASVGAMVTDWTSEYGPGFNYDVRQWYIGGTPWENADAYRMKSSLSHVSSVTTPTLILHGMSDRTDTEPQSMMFFQALKDQGKTTRYIRFPREPHGFREPHHQRIRDVEEIRWIQRYVRGIDWTPWERKEEKKAEEKVVS